MNKMPQAPIVQGFGEMPRRLVLAEALDLIREAVYESIQCGALAPEDFEIVDAALAGSRVDGTARPDSDLDVVVEYRGRMREDDAFNFLGEMREDGMLRLHGVNVDVNPLRRGEGRSLASWVREYGGNAVFTRTSSG